MDAILQTLMDLGGVNATMVFDSTGQLLGHRGHAIYDRALCEQVSGALVRAIDAVQLQQEDWETVSAQFQDGKLLLRKRPRGCALLEFAARLLLFLRLRRKCGRRFILF